ncbi:MAG: shikimate kinase [Alphaproteobacteria bacterium]|nr:shikimate kinase [Alphaproteobacteria bacterium]
MIFPLPKPLVITGMMGVGKSTLGARLADYYGLDFIDSDKEIVQAAQMSIVDIFEKFGEDYFRSGEERVINRIMQRPLPFIMAVGGGAILSPQTKELLQQKAVTLWVDVDLAVLWKRLKKSKTRPILHTEDPLATLEKLYQTRRADYQQTDIHVNVLTDEDIAITCDIVIDKIAQYATK